MPRVPISIKLEQEFLQRLDVAAGVLEVTRTAFIERAVKRAIDNLDATIAEMGGESRLTAAIIDRLASNQTLLTTVARALGEDLKGERLEKLLRDQPKLREEAKRRRLKKTGGK